MAHKRNRRARALPVLVILLLLPSCSLWGSQPTRTASPAATTGASNILPSPAPEDLQNLLQTEQLLLMTPHPPRDLYDLARRFKLHTALPIPHVGRTTPLNAQAGQEDSFWITNFDSHRSSRIRAKLVYITSHVYMYLEDGQQANIAALQSSANTFETKIYPTDRATFGNEWSPGIDDDVHLTILNAVGLGNGVGGYFSAEDEYPTSVNPYSNDREMFYVNLEGAIPGNADYNSTLAHEFQHMIHWHVHPVDLSWTNEGMSVLAQHLNGYSVDYIGQSYLQKPDTQLNDWASDINTDLPHYGAGYLFMDYFSEHYGGPSILKELLQDPASPPLNFDHVLAKHSYRDRFLDVLRKWFIANFVADPTAGQGGYGYSTIHLQGLTPQHKIESYPLSRSDQVHQFAAEYYDLQAQGRRGTLTVSFKGTPLVRIISNDPYQATSEWWSNRYDNMDSTLTRSFDLTGLRSRRATLQFATWFDLERDYDYAYVEVSTDGLNWTTLKGRYTTTTNPNGANWGSGYTGQSGGISGQKWVQESINLTPYTGKRIQIRFEEVTDDSVNEQGFAVDQIRIPELHFHDTLATDNGWVSNGFIRSNNVLPEHFDVQALVYQGQQFTVNELNIDPATAQGTLMVPDFGMHVSRVVLIVSAYAAETTLPTTYQLNVGIS
jgi:immune inhibitor A